MEGRTKEWVAEERKMDRRNEKRIGGWMVG